MITFKTLFYTSHRVLGTFLSILFLIWFISGFVLIFHYFPRVHDKERMNRLDPLPDNLPAIADIPLPQTKIQNMEMKLVSGYPQLFVTSPDSFYRIPVSKADDFLSYNHSTAYALRWCNSDIVRIDTLYNLEQWIPFSKYRADFPIYKFYFADNKHHQLYISSRTGEAIQFTDAHNRLWAWLGAIPHWVYFTRLRQDTGLWKTAVISISGLGSFMCLSGLVIGVRALAIQYRRKKNLRSVYKKKVYKWHHLSGFIFGIFVFTYIFSGMMSLQRIPQWIVRTVRPDIKPSVDRNFMPMTAISYPLDYRKILDKYSGNIKSIVWSSFGNIPVYKVYANNNWTLIDASADSVKPLEVDSAMLANRFRLVHPEDSVQIVLLTDYDNYYIHQRRALHLPVYKVSANDADKNIYYVNPKTGDIKNYNNNTRLRKWMYQALHCFNIKFLVERPLLWNIVIWSTMTGGTVVSATGVWLGWKWLKRKWRKKNKIK